MILFLLFPFKKISSVVRRKQCPDDTLLKQTQCSVHIVNQELYCRSNPNQLVLSLKTLVQTLLPWLYMHRNSVDFRQNSTSQMMPLLVIILKLCCSLILPNYRISDAAFFIIIM